MKPYILSLKGSTQIRTLDELKQLLAAMIENENFEQCSIVKHVIDNYDELKELPPHIKIFPNPIKSHDSGLSWLSELESASP